MDDEFWEAVAYVQRSRNRRRILETLIAAGRPLTPTELADNLGIVVKSASRASRQLAGKDLITCINPEAPRDRRYRLTERGRSVTETLGRLASRDQETGAAALGESPPAYELDVSEPVRDDAAYVRRSPNRRAVMAELAASDLPLAPSEIADATGTGVRSTSRAVRQLGDRGLARCVTPDADRYRRYELTGEGEAVYEVLSAASPQGST